MADADGLTVAAVGDVLLDRDEPGEAFRHVVEILADADVAFANSEGVYAERWERAPSAGVPLVAPPRCAASLAEAGLTVVSLANNHSVDGGFTALLDGRELLRSTGLATAGAGTDSDDARRPAVLDTSHGRVSVLAYASVFPTGYEARPGWPGLAPLRGYTHFTPWEENEWNPGLLPRVSTSSHPVDEEALVADIAAAREYSDVVLVSVHWGDFTRPYVLTDHERRTARTAVDAGADAVLGHHHHLLRGVEFHRGRPIFYGLGHFAFDLPDFEQRLSRDAYLGRGGPATVRASARRFGEHRIGPRDGYPLLPFHPDGRLTGIAVIDFRVGGVTAGFVPCLLGPDNAPRPATSGEEIDRVADYLQRCLDEEDLAVVLDRTARTPGGQPLIRIEPAPTEWR